MRENDLREGRSADAGFDVFTHFLHDLPQRIIEESGAHQRGQSDTPFGQPWPLGSWPDVPTRVLIGRDDRFFPAGFQRRIAEDRLGITPDEIAGGHLLALGHPAELADRLEAYRRGGRRRRRLSAGRPRRIPSWRGRADALRDGRRRPARDARPGARVGEPPDAGAGDGAGGAGAGGGGAPAPARPRRRLAAGHRRLRRPHHDPPGAAQRRGGAAGPGGDALGGGRLHRALPDRRGGRGRPGRRDRRRPRRAPRRAAGVAGLRGEPGARAPHPRRARAGGRSRRAGAGRGPGRRRGDGGGRGRLDRRARAPRRRIRGAASPGNTAGC